MDPFWIGVAVAGVAMLVGAGIGYYAGIEAGYDEGTRDVARKMRQYDAYGEAKRAQKMARSAQAMAMINRNLNS